MKIRQNLCPVCRKTVTPTRARNICGHYDTQHNICPASYRSFDITITDPGTEELPA